MKKKNNKHKQRFGIPNINNPTLSVELYANQTLPAAFLPGRRIFYAYPTPICDSVPPFLLLSLPLVECSECRRHTPTPLVYFVGCHDLLGQSHLIRSSDMSKPLIRQRNYGLKFSSNFGNVTVTRKLLVNC